MGLFSKKEVSEYAAEQVGSRAAGLLLKASGYGAIASATSFIGDAASKYISDSDRLFDKLERKGHDRDHVEKQYEKFNEYYFNAKEDSSLGEIMVRAAGSKVAGDFFSKDFANAMQFKKMIESGGTMEEFEQMNKQMGGRLDLSAYAKWADEAQEESSRIDRGSRGLDKIGDEAAAAGVKDSASAREYLKDNFIKKGPELQYNEIEKELWGRGYFWTQNEAEEGKDGREAPTPDGPLSDMDKALMAATDVNKAGLDLREDRTEPGVPEGTGGMVPNVPSVAADRGMA